MSTLHEGGIMLPPDTTVTVSDAGFWGSHGPALDAKGYELVPIKPGTKRPVGMNWRTTNYNQAKALRRGFNGHGVGVKTGKVVPVDIDCTDPQVVEQVVAWCRENVGPAPLRIGRAPRAMLFYRTSTQRRKAASRAWRAPDGEMQCVELFGDGQQVAVYAIHPTTGQPYYWPDAELTDIALEALTEMSDEQGRAAELFRQSRA